MARSKCLWPAPVYEAHLDSGEVVRCSYWAPADKPLTADRGRRVVASFLRPGEAIVAGYLCHAGNVWIDGAAPHKKAHIEALSRAQERIRQAWRSYRVGVHVLIAAQRAYAEALALPETDRTKFETLKMAKRDLRLAEQDTRAGHWRAIALAACRDRRAIMRRIDQGTLLEPVPAVVTAQAKIRKPKAAALVELARKALERGNAGEALALLQSYA